ncbi:hypothetical protein LOK49_LG04G03092 [Camellia lanceoleosa]|uniref:Uncharacterized protein n=1 Tax=Camellia lanceoleosa TaxID=1840588 RepID=A0ACC0I439_9ERIC|nr:hypothetical protein LOK49_LG04G03092 [Camellia lanceoleosa]
MKVLSNSSCSDVTRDHKASLELFMPSSWYWNFFYIDAAWAQVFLMPVPRQSAKLQNRTSAALRHDISVHIVQKGVL